MKDTKKTSDYKIVSVAYGDSYDVQGIVCIYIPEEDFAAFSYYSHGSSYDTWDCVPSVLSETFKEGWSWSGTLANLITMATEKIDPNVPGRIISSEDSDYEMYQYFYEGFLSWYKRVKKDNFSSFAGIKDIYLV